MDTPQRSSSSTPTGGPITAVLVAIGLSAFGIAATQVTTAPAFLLEPGLATAPGEAPVSVRTLFFVLNFLGFVLAGAIYLAVTNRGWDYVDLRVPTVRDWLYVVGGIGVSILFYVVVALLLTVIDLPASENQVVEFIGGDPEMVLIMIAIVFFVNAPAEEFLFRNVVQKRLYDAFSRMQAVVGASLIFALVHLPVYVINADSALATAVSLTVVFGGSLIFGYLYAKTDNLVAPTAAHAAFNAVQFALLYLGMVLDLESVESTPTGLLAAVGPVVGW
ncbi:CPBP family intramembrane glutamic endopeptidase [Natrarchaeobaculum aegyptiacum]|uniref:Abortive phage infection protein n=1 Tax=Natrarchaeobaculum aegyptiacum TaxID=745377 RepID=A0A2Z2HQ11_9EURY|nr:CPBP family intramembrane glutamic endopeptidase [Natrarchaeobaculum aegyptiacum]ARS89170.1 abortive phage infection protein [Natrarchaeobaculum aegyptiacum]